MLREEWKSLLNNKMLILVIAVIATIPAIYAGLFLASMWDPYGNVENLPVAVVNEDKAVDYNDTTLNVGENLIENLKDNDSLDFNFVDKTTASDGLKDGTYYMVITIPEDFSKNAATLMDENPTKMELQYEINPGTNYIASKLSQTAVSKIKASVSEEVTKTYTESVFDQISTVGDGMQEAADGAEEISNGMEDALQGNETITTNLKKLSDSTSTLTEGTNTLNTGVKDYVTGANQLADGAKQLQALEKLGEVYTGINQIQTAAQSLNAGTQQLESGLFTLNSQLGGTASLASGLGDAVAGMNKASEGMTSASTGIATASGICTQVSGALAGMPTSLNAALPAYETVIGNAVTDGNTKVTEANANIATGKTGVDEATAKIQQLQTLLASGGAVTADQLSDVSASLTTASGSLTQVGQLDPATYSSQGQAITNGISSSLTESMTQLSNAKAGLDTIASGLASGATEMSQGASDMAAGQEKLATATEQISALQSGVSQLYTGAQNLNSGMSQLASGATQLQTKTSAFPEAGEGIKKLNTGFDQLIANNSKLTDGVQKLADGATQMQDGSEKLYDGSVELNDGLTQLSDGSSELKTSLLDGATEMKDTTASDETIDMFAAPIVDKESTMTSVADNGHAMAPYMMCVGLWVGSLAFCLMYPLTKYHGKLKSGLGWWASKASILYPLALLQGVLVVVLLNVFDGFTPVEMAKTILFACLTSMAFASIQYFFNITFGKVGSFLMLVFMVIQLAGSAGTYPVELSAEFVSKIHAFVPFTYAVNAFRSTISGGESIMTSIWVMIGLIAVFTVLTIAEFQIRAKRMEKGAPLLMDFLEEKGLA